MTLLSFRIPRSAFRVFLWLLLFLFPTCVWAESELKISPAGAKLEDELDRVQLTVAVKGDDGAVGDVTSEASFESLDPEVIAVNARGRVRPLTEGRGRVRATWKDDSAEVEVEFKKREGAPAVDFRRDVIPVLSRAGCTAGACHAAQYGKGGLKLSLLGFAPERDHAPLVRDEAQRRISLVAPADSLILQKATLQVSHGGGRRFKVDSVEYDILLRWIQAGAPRPAKTAPQVVDLAVTPASAVYQPGQQQQLRVVATMSDDTTRDVTHLAMYDSMSETVVKIDGGGRLRATGPGQAPIMIRYRGQAKISLVIVPYRELADDDSLDFEPQNFVDRLVLKRWRQLGLRPTRLSSDEEFLRRAYLDAIGTLPEPGRVREFLASNEPDKRQRVIDELLGVTGDPQRDVYVNQWSAYWTLKWGDLIRNNRNKLGDGGMWALYNWVRGSLRENKPMDRFVRELITAQGSVFQSGPANYFKITTKPDELAEATAQTFLGVRLQCAKCHHHPFEVYSQADYYGLAAFFTRVGIKSSPDFGALGGDAVVLVKPSGSIRHPRTRKVMPPTPLRGEPVETDGVRDLRRPLARWLTSPDNRLFARNLVNRFWGYLMGTGLVEPIDDMRATNPASNPELLEALADDLIQHKFDLRHLMRVIMSSRAYQLASRPHPDNASDTRFYTHYNVKRLPAEVLLDAIDTATGTEEKYAGVPAGTRAIELPDSNYSSYFLDTMGRPKRVITCECERTSQPNLAQILHIANGDLLSRKISDAKGRVARLVKQHEADEPVIEALYLRTLSRLPSADERQRAAQVIKAAPQRKEGVEDLLWALCNSREFLFCH